MLVCMRCGAFAMARPLLLMRPCAKQRANAAARRVRNSVLSGKHPEDGRAIGKIWRVLPLPSVITAALTRPQTADDEGGSSVVALAACGSASGLDPCGFDSEDYDVVEDSWSHMRWCLTARLRGAS